MIDHIPSTMRAAVTRDWNDIRIEEVPVPELEPGEVLVRVGACGICGTDLKIVSGVYAGTWHLHCPSFGGSDGGAGPAVQMDRPAA